MSISQAKLEANRANAQLSTGPVTPAGKARSSANAISHGIFSRAVLLPGEDRAALAALRSSVLRRMNPHDPMELNLVEQYVTAAWRLQRLLKAEQETYLDQAQADQQALLDARAIHGEVIEEDDWQPPMPDAGWVMWRLMSDGKPSTLERLSRYEQRLQGTMRRCLQDLEKLRQQLPADQQPSELVQQQLDEQAVQIEATDGSPEQISSLEQQLYRSMVGWRNGVLIEEEMKEAYSNGRRPGQVMAEALQQRFDEHEARQKQPTPPDAAPPSAA
jgi:hypothetical protein